MLEDTIKQAIFEYLDYEKFSHELVHFTVDERRKVLEVEFFDPLTPEYPIYAEISFYEMTGVLENQIIRLYRLCDADKLDRCTECFNKWKEFINE